ncbi:unnamed protein product [Brassica oleracea var. botrytis]
MEELAICEDIDHIDLQGLKDILWLMWVVHIGGNAFPRIKKADCLVLLCF